jgi:hypothetical protein
LGYDLGSHDANEGHIGCGAAEDTEKAVVPPQVKAHGEDETGESGDAVGVGTEIHVFEAENEEGGHDQRGEKTGDLQQGTGDASPGEKYEGYSPRCKSNGGAGKNRND